VVAIDEGKRTPVKEVLFEGNEQIPDSDLRGALKQPSRWNPLWWFRKKRFDPDELEAARLEIRDIYMSRGYLDAVVDLPVVETVDEHELRVKVHVSEGTLYHIGKMSLSGVALFSEMALWKGVKVKAGDIASSDAITAAAQALRDYYGSRGYINTVVKPLLDADGSKRTVNVAFSVTEGALTHIRNIEIQGNSRTRDKVIRRELLVYPGDIYDEVKVRRSEKILHNLGYFETVRSSPVGTRSAEEKDLVFQVEEKRTGNIMLGMGFSSVDDLMGFLDLTQGNFDIAGWPYFTGGGQKLKLHTQVGSKRREYSLSFTEPWFLDRKLSLGFDVYRREAEYSDYDVTRTGGAISLGKSLPWANRIDFRYRLERAELGDVSDSNEYFYVDSPSESYYFTDEPRKLTESTLTVSLTHDDRDNPFVPTRGNRTSVFAGLTGGPMGFDTDMYDLGLTSIQYVPLWFRHVLSLRMRWETVEGYGDTTTLPIDDRLFIGGGRTIRGYHYRDVGPKVVRYSSDGEVAECKSVGGQSLALASAEYSIPVVPKIRFAGFYDIGNVWRDSFDIDFDQDHLASGAGMGIRFDIPGFPIRIDYAWPVHKDNELTETDRWIFWIGYDY
jgi:outer membrane protein insertion porin family